MCVSTYVGLIPFLSERQKRERANKRRKAGKIFLAIPETRFGVSQPEAKKVPFLT